MASVLLLVAAGIVILSARGDWRLLGLVPLCLAVALGFDQLLISAIAWSGFVGMLISGPAGAHRNSPR
jgi:hypothetical protein